MPTTKEQKAQGWRSITEVLGGWHDQDELDFYLDNGRKEVNRIFKVAGKIGTEVHEACEGGVTKKPSPEAVMCMQGWAKFLEVYKPTIKSWGHEALKNEAQMVLGHYDFIATVNGVDYVVDIKTSAKSSWKHKAQSAWYGKQLGLPAALLYLGKQTGAQKFVVVEPLLSWCHVAEMIIWLDKESGYGIDV